MKTLLALYIILPSSLSFAGVGGGGVGTHPETGFMAPGVEFVKTLSVENGKAKFAYKPFDKKIIELHMMNLNDLNDAYREAIVKSNQLKQWTQIE